MRTTTLAGVAVAGAIMLYVAEAEAAPHRGYECDEWRDYLFNAETGDFIEWVGKPYWVCKDLGAPVSYPEPPRSPEGPDYGGGYGYPHRPSRQEQCARCEAGFDRCISDLDKGSERCLRHYERVFRGWCRTNKIKRDGTYPKGKFQCHTERDHRGRPYSECGGPGMSECIQSFAMDGVSTTSIDSGGFSIKLSDFFSLNASSSRSVTASFPPGSGFVGMCSAAMVQASNVCQANKGLCEEAAGGCR
jgi:hypothetical protein